MRQIGSYTCLAISVAPALLPPVHARFLPVTKHRYAIPTSALSAESRSAFLGKTYFEHLKGEVIRKPKNRAAIKKQNPHAECAEVLRTLLRIPGSG